MLYSLLHGDVVSAVRFNVVALGFLAVAYATWTYGRLVGQRITGWQHHRWSAIATLVLVSVWFVVRNVPYPPFTALRV